MAKVITMGEIMLRLSTPNFEKFIQADEFDINYGGGEANVAVSLANYGHDAEYVTALPENEIGDCAIAALRKYGVKTDNIARCGERVGIYYLESGSAMRPSKVVYDRAHSSISTATAADFDFDKIFEGADWFHFTGITPAISDSAAVLTEEALKAAKKHGVKVSCDLNFRKKLWSSEKAQKVMKNLMKYVDVCIGNEEDANLVLGYKPGNTDVTSGELELAGYKSIFEQMVADYNFEYCVSSLRVSHSASDNGAEEPVDVKITQEMDPSAINTDEDGDGIEVLKIVEETFNGDLVIVYDPSRVHFYSIRNFSTEGYGKKITDIIEELSKPGRDPRDEMPKPILRQDVLKFEDLKEGMILTGTVRNVIDFGCFVDIGVKYDGLVHISEMSEKYIKNPSEVVSVGDIVKVKVIKIDSERHKVGLSMKFN